MTAALWRRRAGRLGFALVLGSTAAPARGAGADEANCWGRWRLDVAPPPPERETLLAPDSWCRGAKLPRTFTVEVRPGADGRRIITGDPLRPTDVTTGPKGCGFEFSKPASGPDYYELSIGVYGFGAVVEGTATCSERTRTGPNSSSGITIELSAKGSHSPGPAGSSNADGPDRLAASIAAACRSRNAEVLWKMMSPKLRSAVEDRAAQVRSAARLDLRRLYGYKGRPEDFKGVAYLRTTMTGEDSPTNLCWRVDEWKLSPAVVTAAGYVVPVERGDFAIGFTFTKSDRGWELDQLSHWVRVPKP